MIETVYPMNFRPSKQRLETIAPVAWVGGECGRRVRRFESVLTESVIYGPGDSGPSIHARSRLNTDPLEAKQIFTHNRIFRTLRYS